MSARTQGRRRRAVNREERQAATLPQRPFKQINYRYKPQEILSADQTGAIHRTALQILQEVGFKVLSPRARKAYASAGFDVNEAAELVRFQPEGLEALVAQAPSEF